MAVATAIQTSSFTTTKRHRLCIAPLGQTLVQAGSSRWLHDKRLTGKERSVPKNAVIFPAVTARILIEMRRKRRREWIFVVLAGQFAGLQPVQRLESIKIHTGLSSVTPYAFFNLNKIASSGDGLPFASGEGGATSEC